MPEQAVRRDAVSVARKDVGNGAGRRVDRGG
jgi:hypothetical protein